MTKTKVSNLKTSIDGIEKSFAKFEATNDIEGIVALFKMLLYLLKDLILVLSKDSRNSSIPPSQDKGSRGSANKGNGKGKEKKKKQGGQPGHTGKNLEMVATPDIVIVHKVEECECCKKDLQNKKIIKVERRQSFDIEVKVVVTEHQSEIKECSCGHTTRAMFPVGINSPVQYGNMVKTLAVYNSQYQLIPYDRVAQTFADVFGLPISPGTISNFNNQFHDRLEETEKKIEQSLLSSRVAHFDETGVSAPSLKWIHVMSNEYFTYLYAHSKRGRDALVDGPFSNYHGIAVHDNWASYFSYEVNHALCNGHLLRDLTFVYEEEKQKWAKKMSDLLLNILAVVEKKSNGDDNSLSPYLLKKYIDQYEKILKAADKKYPAPEGTGKRGRVKKGKARNVLERLINKKDETLLFMHDFEVPFTNNQAERDFRMAKVQQKISGCFRSDEGAKIFCRSRGYISTLRKQEINVIHGICNVFNCGPDLIDYTRGI